VLTLGCTGMTNKRRLARTRRSSMAYQLVYNILLDCVSSERRKQKGECSQALDMISIEGDKTSSVNLYFRGRTWLRRI
jgi:hypothetical protein